MRFAHTFLRRRFLTVAAFGVLAFCVCVLAAHPAFAQQEALDQVAAGGGLPTTNLAIMIARLIRVFLGTLGIIFTIVVLYAGFIFMTAQGDADKVKRATAMIKNGVIGMIICIFAFTITQFILSRLVKAASSGGSTSGITDQYSEPLSGSLGAGIIESHYPERFAIGVPRNTRIMVTFKEAVNPSSIISGYADNDASTDLNADNVLIYPTADGESAALGASDVLVSVNEAHTTYVFDPVALLGNPSEDTNYTVALSNRIEKENGTAAFVGAYSDGYDWTFEVSTEVDLTPPQVVSVLPRDGRDEARNVTVSITFDEPMDPVAATGTYSEGADGNFRNIEVLSEDGTTLDGTYSISNGYKTVEFTPTDACGQDPCGDTIYCLPGNEALSVEAHAATLSDEAPQAQPVGVYFDGLVDASGNSLDGSGDDPPSADGPPDDDFQWQFTTTDEINDTVPHIDKMSPGIGDENADQDADVTIRFSVPMKSSTLSTSNISLWPDPWYEFWFTVGKTDVDTDGDGEADYTYVSIHHPTMVSADDLGWTYWPVVTRGVKSNWQICMFPAYGPSAYDESDTACRGDSSSNDGVTGSAPYCCDGAPSFAACPTSVEGIDLPDTSE